MTGPGVLVTFSNVANVGRDDSSSYFDATAVIHTYRITGRSLSAAARSDAFFLYLQIALTRQTFL